MSPPDKNSSPRRRIALPLVVGSLGMLALSFASVPLYRVFCAATGFGGTTQVAKQNLGKQGERVLTVRFRRRMLLTIYRRRFKPEDCKNTRANGPDGDGLL